MLWNDEINLNMLLNHDQLSECRALSFFYACMTSVAEIFDIQCSFYSIMSEVRGNVVEQWNDLTMLPNYHFVGIPKIV